MEGASAGSPDFEKVPNDFDEEDDRVCDMDVGSERADRPQRLRQDNNVDGEEGDVEEAQQQEEEEEEEEDVEMASEGVTESGLESYGNADEDDFAEDERLDNLNRVGDPPLPPSAPAAQWHQPNPFADPWAEPLRPLQGLENSPHPAPLAGAVASPSGADPETPTQAQVWPDRGSDPLDPENPGVPHCVVKERPQSAEACESGPASSRALAPGVSLSSTLSSFDTTPPSATSLASCGFDAMTTASNSNAQSTGESCVKSPGIFSLEELSDETKESCPIPKCPQ